MPVPFHLQNSEVPFSRTMQEPLAVTWKDCIIIWKGPRSSVVYFHVSGKWIEKATSGDMPRECDWPCIDLPMAPPQVLFDKMFVLANPCHNDGDIHTLDLNTLVWTKCTPKGTPPAGRSYGMASWAHMGYLYFFGGHVFIEQPERKDFYDDCPSYIKRLRFNDWHDGSNCCFCVNHLFCYNVSENSWEWPHLKGTIPSPRIEQLAIVNDGIVFLYGGYDGKQQYNDLHILDMATLTWRLVHGNIEENLPMDQFHTFTRISKNEAVLYGVKWLSEFMADWRCEDDCWFLDLQISQNSGQSAMWTRMRSHMLRSDHAAALEPVSRRLWVVGGREEPGYRPTINIMKMTPNLLPLKLLAIDCIRRCIGSADLRQQPDQLPVQLRKEIKSYAKHIGEEYWCSKAKCNDCQVNMLEENAS